MREMPNVRAEASFAQTVEKATTCPGHKDVTAKRSHNLQDLTETEMEDDLHEEEDVHLEEGDKAEDVRRTTIVRKCGTRTRKATGKS